MESSKDWFQTKIRTAAGFRKRILTTYERQKNTTVIGKMYFFVYNPKHKLTLPMYDKFPLVFPIEPYTDGFLGLNLHYLSQNERTVLLKALSGFMTDTKYTPRTRLKITYDLLSSTKRLASFSRPCIKRYLFSHVWSTFIEVPSNEWSKAINLPVADWVVKS